MAKAITSREEDYSQWYNDLVYKAGLADTSAVRGCMVIKPHGYALWENMRDVLDRMFKDTGHVNAYFPLFVPKSLFEAEEKNAEGFAKECAVVTHYRLKTDPNNKAKLIVDPEAKLEEELIIRPTSEAIIWNTYRDWIHSYRDLPLLINQWANVVRWEMRTRPFLRTAEFLWQEGHTAHATEQDALEEALKMHEVYTRFAEDYMAMPVIKGAKTENERFAGAEETFTIEAMMQDGKALQAGTSHYLGQNFAKAFEVKFLTDQNKEEYVYATSWGVSTRLIGALVMCHSDDDGLILPPKLAPIQVILVPIPKPSLEIDKVGEEILQALKVRNIRVQYDKDERNRPGFKFAEYELKGVPIRIGIGARDLEKGVVEIARRDTKEKELVEVEKVADYVQDLLKTIQQNLFDRAKAFRETNTHFVDTWDEFQKTLEEKGGFIYAHWDGNSETEELIKEKTKATIRCIPLDAVEESGKCILTGRPSQRRVLFAKAY
ncbi:MAG: proline--tRNA ligase [Saprospiraceae bacterium]|nr:proline--tRNA ligase [Candidatus Vicinibacter affinis]MBP6172791.1 proline--tRNA ligase [Saprospiraceae bacterium]MBK6572706.1 proline--tRNA ligase [Candidatus Vicinibacter affinis]MBK6824484.1 proline--tRNA ligase [Candidatus Vicinibacter affinis]MBK7303439.1 proline--tRNA ligase [Candidatus Vicinibacter affinis]